MKLRFKATDAYLIALAILVVYGFFLRLFSLDALSYWIDESYSVLSAINIGHYGLPYFDSGVLYARSLPHSYLLWGIGSLFGFSEIPMRLPSVIFGVGVIIVLFYIGRALYSNNVGLLTALLCTFLNHMV